MIDLRKSLALLAIPIAASVFVPREAAAKPIGADAPCFDCCGLTHFDVPASKGPCPDIRGGSFVSTSFGTMGETYPVVNARSANGAGLELSLYYASYIADGEKASLNTVMGFGWSHSYNIFLFTQGLDLYKASPGGLVTKYQRIGRRGPLRPTRGAQQTIAEKTTNCSRQLGTSIEISNNPGGTTYCFEQIPGNPLRVEAVAPWMLKLITDRNGNQTKLSYNTGGLLEVVQDTYGRQITFEYTSNRLTKISYHLVPGYDPSSGTFDTKLSYDSFSNLVSIEDPLEPTHQFVRYEYNELHQIVSKTDKNGKRWQYLYDAARKPIGIVDPDGKAMFGLTNPVEWATKTNELFLNAQRLYTEAITTRKDGRGNDWKYSYDTNGYLKDVIAPDQAKWSYTYDDMLDPANAKYATLNVATETDPNGNPTSYEYDAKGNRVKMVDALGNCTTYKYESRLQPPFDLLKSVSRYAAAATDPQCKDPDSRTPHSTTEYKYDLNGNRIQEIRDVAGLKLQKDWTYDAKGNVETETVHNDTGSGPQTTKYSYDAFDNLASMIDPMLHETQYKNDSRGNRIRITDANIHSTDYLYDELNRLTKVTDPLGFTTDYGYDGNDNRIEVQKQVAAGTNQITRYRYDVRNRLTQEIRITAAAPLLTRYTYDDNDNRTSVIDPRGKTTSFEYDQQNRLTLVRDALQNTTDTAYDRAGNRIRVIGANKHYTYFQYDKLNRVTQEIKKIGDTSPIPDGNDIVTQNFYDTGAQITSRGCQNPQCGGPTPGSANISYVIDPELKYTYFKYDKVDRRVMTIRKVGDTAEPETV